MRNNDENRYNYCLSLCKRNMSTRWLVIKLIKEGLSYKRKKDMVIKSNHSRRH